MSGRVLAGRYELLEKKGDGGMAVVYKAKDTYLNRFVAIKILKPEYIRDSKFVDNFRKESQAAAKLSHPNIVSVYDVGKEGNIYYIVMELLDGDSLGDVIERNGPLSEKRVTEISRQIAAGLSAAHKKHIIHRDIKPHNILMTEDGRAKITDFGIAKAVNGGTLVTGTGTVMGSVHYLSPEQAKGGAVDARSDIYSLGIVMFEMLTGSVPYDGDSPVSVAIMHVNNQVPKPSSRNLYVSSMMDEIVQKATARFPEDRFSSADELIRALNGEVIGGAVSSGSFGRKAASSETQVFTAAAAEMAAEAERKSEFRTSRPERRVKPEPIIEEPEDDDYDDLDEYDDYEEKKRGFGGLFGRKKKKSESSKGGKKRSPVLAVILALLVALPLSLLVINIMDGISSRKVEIPPMAGYTQEQAIQTLESMELKYEISTTLVEDTEIEAGLVSKTDPAAGEKVRKNSRVTIYISSGPPAPDVVMQTVPNVETMSLDDAKSKLMLVNLAVGELTYEFHDTLPDGFVIRQDPGADTQLAEGSSVNLVISKGKEVKTVKVPDLMDCTISQARNKLDAAGLKLGDVSEKESDKPEGTVIGQGVSAGTEIAEGESVSIVVSKEKKPEPVEKTQKKKIDFSQAPDDIFTLTVTLTAEDGSVTHVVSNEKHSRSEGSVTVELKGSGTARLRVIMNGMEVENTTITF